MEDYSFRTPLHAQERRKNMLIWRFADIVTRVMERIILPLPFSIPGKCGGFFIRVFPSKTNWNVVTCTGARSGFFLLVGIRKRIMSAHLLIIFQEQRNGWGSLLIGRFLFLGHIPARPLSEEQ